MRRTRAVIATAALVLAGCGADANAPAASGAPTASASVVPDVQVLDLATGQKVALPSRVATDKPTLLWMWAPS